jgi:hypothetical protein
MRRAAWHGRWRPYRDGAVMRCPPLYPYLATATAVRSLLMVVTLLGTSRRVSGHIGATFGPRRKRTFRPLDPQGVAATRFCRSGPGPGVIGGCETFTNAQIVLRA